MKTKNLGKGKTLYLFDESELDKRLKDVFYVIEANSYERHNIWKSNEFSLNQVVDELMRGNPVQKREPRLVYEQDAMGFGMQIGDFHGESIFVTFNFFKLNGLTILTYYPSSMTINFEIVEEWFKIHCNPTWDGRRAHCDADNFHNCMFAVEDKTKKHEHRKNIAHEILNEIDENKL